MPAVSSQQVRTKKRKDEKRRKGRSGGFILPGRGEGAKALPPVVVVVVFGRDALWCCHLQNYMIPFTMV